MAYTLTTPSFEPVTLALAKEWLKVSDTSEDTSITAIIQAAREFVEHHTGQMWAERTAVEYFDCFPNDDTIRLSLAPASAISSVQYIANGSGSTYGTFSSASYAKDFISDPPRIVLGEDYDWPDTESAPNAVKVTYMVGQATTGAIPESVKTSMRLLIAFWFENREDMNLPMAERSAKNLLLTQKRYFL